MEKMVSVIVPTRNRSSFLVRAVNSILSQTHSIVEVILIDDCSSDVAPNLVDLYFKDIHKVIYVRNKDRLGGGASRNKGISIAREEYSDFQDEDDE